MNERQETSRHPIRVAARRTGLSRDVLRAWEIRYRAVEPDRTPGGQRLYSDADISRLRLLRRALAAGRRIGQVAKLSSAELKRLVLEDEGSLDLQQPVRRGARAGVTPLAFLHECLDAVAELDAVRLAAALDRAVAALPGPELIDRVLAPLMSEIGELWLRRHLTPAHERLATIVVRQTLDEIRDMLQRPEGPTIVVATPSGQRHEIGAMLAAASAASRGWHVIYLGADLPAASIAEAAAKSGARAVALSIIYPADDPALPGELRQLRKRLASAVPIIVGGRAAGEYRDIVREIGARSLCTSEAFYAALDAIGAAVHGRTRWED